MLKVLQTNKGLSLFTDDEYTEGSTIMPLTGDIVEKEEAAFSAIQIGRNQFIHNTYGKAEYPYIMNHSCDPNCEIDVHNLQVLAKRNIKPGEELTFNYNTTEADMDDEGIGFDCLCGAENCLHHIGGYKPKFFPFICEYCDKDFGKDIIAMASHIGKVHDVSHGQQ
jgi:hypothetical protein